MKKFLFLITIALTFLACRSDDFGNANSALQPVDFTVTAKYDLSLGGLLSKNATVVLTNTNTGDSYTQNTNDNGDAHFHSILPGSYTVTASKKMSNTEFHAAFGYDVGTDEINFNGNQENVKVNANVTSTTIEMKSARLGDLVIKQIYYAGSHSTQGASFRDQFIEIYNNSNELIYADGLYIGQLYGKNNTTTSNVTLGNGQFDWSKSIGMTMGNAANTDYVYADYIVQIPGNGTQYPVQPGESIVIAQSALNHKAPLTSNSGDPINIQNPELTIDLSNSEFEVYLGTFRQSIGEAVYNYDIQNPAVTDVNIAYWGIPGYYSGNKDFLMDNQGRDSFVIFRSNELASYGAYTDPSVSTVTANSKYFKQIPVSVIIDGVDLQHHNPSSQRPKMLNSATDAGFINTDAAFNSQSVIRKTKKTLPNGRKILEDSNNSSVDFVKLNKANPKGFAL